MSFVDSHQRTFLQTLSDLAHCNPFLPERIELERRALGDDFDESSAVWSKQGDVDSERVNIDRLMNRARPLAAELHSRLAAGAEATRQELALFQDLALYVLYHQHRRDLSDIIERSTAGQAARKVDLWRSFRADYEHWLGASGVGDPADGGPGHWLACFFQLRRAFHHIFNHIVGFSMPAARLRASIWQSVFTRDMRRYRRVLFDRMGDLTTLVVGASGTGKELVARAVGLSRYVPFDEENERFSEDFAGSFHALNLSALAPTLIESELFGHRRGAFTGAVDDRTGWLEACPALGTVFLDEIGELQAVIQVKLLRVLESRVFQRLGEQSDRRFCGKIIAATNRDLAAEMREGRFREDLYYRLCSDIIVTPSLREQLDDSPDSLMRLLTFISRRLVGDDDPSLAAQVHAWIDRQMPAGYAWPGNIRELEQCVRNIMVHGEYRPPPAQRTGGAAWVEALAAATGNAALTADQLLRRYCTYVYAQTGSYEESARRLNLDRRTVKSKVEADLLAKFKNASELH